MLKLISFIFIFSAGASFAEDIKLEENNVQNPSVALPSNENKITLTTSTEYSENKIIENRSFGHLLTSSNKVLSKNEIGIGTRYLGYGITDHWTVATSPFLIEDFSMYNIALRGVSAISSQEDVGIEFGYFKTYGKEAEVDKMWREYCNMGYSYSEENCSRTNYPNGFGSFKMEAWMTRLTYSRKLNSIYRVNISASYFYYIDDEKPFSLRMDPQNEDMFALNLTSLHQFRIGNFFYFNYEFGVWGMNYQYPYIHTGASFEVQVKKFLMGLGASTTFSPNFPKERARVYSGYDSRQSIHPEIQVQTFF